MNIKPVFGVNGYNKKVFFSKKEESRVFGFDDEISQNKREQIRNYQQSKYMTYQNIFEKEGGRLSEYNLNSLIKTLVNRPKEVNYESVMSIPVPNVDMVGKNSYRGASLVDAPKSISVLKKAGIERIVDLVGYKKYKENVEKVGLEYFSYPVDSGAKLQPLFLRELFSLKDEYIKREYSFYNIQNEEETKFLSSYFDEQESKQKENLVNLIQFLQKDYFYIGCEFGTYKTDNVLFLNNCLNPKAGVDKIRTTESLYLDAMKTLYYKLTPEDKQKMQWTKKFDEEFIPKIEEAEEHLRKREDYYFNLWKELNNN